MCNVPQKLSGIQGGRSSLWENNIIVVLQNYSPLYVEGMVDGLNDHRIADIGEFFAEGFRWMGNAGCGTKNNLKEFQDNWQKPFQVLFVL